MSMSNSVKEVYKSRTLSMEKGNIQILGKEGKHWKEDWNGMIEEVRENSGECGVINRREEDFLEK